MSEYKKYFEAYCKEHDLELRLSSEMPVGYETANGTFDVSSRTVFINAEKLNKEPKYSKLFYLFMNCVMRLNILNRDDLMKQ